MTSFSSRANTVTARVLPKHKPGSSMYEKTIREIKDAIQMTVADRERDWNNLNEGQIKLVRQIWLLADDENATVLATLSTGLFPCVDEKVLRLLVRTFEISK